MNYINKETLFEQIKSLEQLARKRVYDTPTNSPAYERYCTQYSERVRMLTIVKSQPTADVVEVRHGRWIKHKENCLEYRCVVCEYELCRETNYCPNCGARMDGERREI